MRIAYICADPGIPVFGTKGSSIHVQEVIRGFLRHGAQVDLFATRLDGDIPEDLRGVGLHWLPALPKGDLAVREQASLGANRSLSAALERQGPFDLVYERYSLWSFAGMEYARSHGLRGVLEVNAPLIEEQVRYRGLVNRSGAEQVAQRVFVAASKVLAVSEEVARHVEHYPSMRSRLHVVPNGVDPARFPAGLQPSYPAANPATFTVGFVGTLKPWHGLNVLVEAFAAFHRAVPNSRLLIVGDGPERENLVSSAAAAGILEAMHLTGAVPLEQIPGHLASMDVAVAPYPQQDDFYFSPLKVYEYMAAGLPIVASRIGQVARLIRDEENGLLCHPGDPAALVAALERIRQEPTLGTRLGANAREAVLREHTWDAVVQRVLNLVHLAPTGTDTLLAASA